LWGRICGYDASEHVGPLKAAAEKLAALLEKIFKAFASKAKEKPFEVREEMQLSQKAYELSEAYDLAGLSEKAMEAEKCSNQARQRAQQIIEQTAVLDEYRNSIQIFEEWEKVPRWNVLRGLWPVSIWAWTKREADIEIAKWRIKIAQAEVDKYRRFPKLLPEKLIALALAKEVLANLLGDKSLKKVELLKESHELCVESDRLKKLQDLLDAIKRMEPDMDNEDPRIAIPAMIQVIKLKQQQITVTTTEKEKSDIQKEIDGILAKAQKLRQE
jgi:hypothetical protein